MRQFLAILATALLVQSASAQSLWRNFFTTNRDPIVEVVAGSNATVQATTVGSNLRRFTVNSTATGGTNSLVQTNISYVAVTNAPWQFGDSDLTNWATLNTNVLSTLGQTNISYVAVTNAPWQQGSANLTNWGSISTNESAFLANNQVFTGSNYFTQPLTLSIATNTPANGKIIVATSSTSAGWTDTLPTLNIGDLVVTNPPYLNLANSTNLPGAGNATNFWGQLSPTNWNHGTGASSATYARGDGTWGTPAGGGAATNAIANTNGVSYGTLTADSVNATNVSSGIVKGTNGIAPGVLTIATLPAGPVAGQTCWASDVITSRGSGGFVFYDGSNWRNSHELNVATSDVNNFILNCLAAGYSGQSPISSIYFSRDQVGPGAGMLFGFPRITSAIGTGASAVGYSSSSTYGEFSAFKTGTTTTGTASAAGPSLTAMAAGDYFGSGGIYSVTAPCYDTNTYWCAVGMESTGAMSTYPVNGVFFLFDQYNINSHNQGYTNNWICVVAKSSGYNYLDSGLAVATGNPTQRLLVIATTSACYFYTNGVLSQTFSTAGSIPVSGLYPGSVGIKKATGTFGVNLQETAPMVHIRHATPRVYP